ncbi:MULTISPECIES: DUF819 family protein [unclassified Spirosoma]|uniref:DUF819 family protein n=1 Tax=unclassified Spirosoma TaxID=2621999 RepID=UPI00095F8A40|nr:MULTISPECIES: DUF819 family protein [unclassified Spirosoma]MBN8822446.1 DUF819 family protein [Spirosoma sp.]OJW73958.1 MAG: hypothetical protein BGO59_12500 [Spirosoma sp. 48-14]
MPAPLITNDAIILGIFLVLLTFIFQTSQSSHPFWQQLYTYVPALLLCYIFPAAMNSLDIISGEQSSLYKVSTNYLLPAALVLLTSTADLRAIARLGQKALITFLSGTVGIIVGAPIAFALVMWLLPGFREQAITHEYWKGLVTISGSWIGGSSSQLALKEIYGCSEELFAIILVVDAVVSTSWTACLIYGAAYRDRIDAWLHADTSSLEEVRLRILAYKEEPDRPANLLDLSTILALGFGGGAFAHAMAYVFSTSLQPYKNELATYGLDPFTSNFLWVVILSTSLGIGLSFTRLRKLEKLGTTDLATLFVYFLIMTIGMRLDLSNLGGNLGLFLVAVIWMLIHVIFMLITARLIRAPYFFVAVGSQANIGGVSTAPAVASVFHPALAPVGVLLAVLSHVLGTYGGLITAWLMRLID